MSVSVSVEGPVEKLGEDLVVLIPPKGIGSVEGRCLRVTIQPWLAERLRVGMGSLVVVDNLGGKFRITRSEKNDGIDTDVVA